MNLKDIGPRPGVRLVLGGLPEVARAAQPLKVGLYIEARISIGAIQAAVPRLGDSHASRYDVVHNLRKIPVAARTHWAPSNCDIS